MIRTERAHLPVVATTHPGATGKNNEDRYAVSAYRLSEQDPTLSVFAVLADGIGGHRGGEVAAEMVVEIISRYVAESSGEQPELVLQNAITEASQQVYAYAQQNGSLNGMGATCACAWVIGSRLYTSSIGDSRIYLMRGGVIRQITTDHTWIQEAIEKGVLKREEARGHPNAHVIRRFVGSPTPPVVDQRLRLNPEEDDYQASANQGARLRPGDRLLLCSDGLTDLVKDTEILEAFTSHERQPAVNLLVEMALQRGGHDNITIITLDFPEAEPVLAPPAAPGEGETARVAVPATAARTRRPWAALGCGALLLLAVLASGLVFLGVLPGWSLIRSGLGLDDATPRPSATLTLPAELLTALPGGQPAGTPTPGLSTTRPAATVPPSGRVSPTGSGPKSGPTYTPWPTNTLPPPP